MANKSRYIAIDGPIGVGKTTLAHLLAEELGASLITEEVQSNPFLEKFYEDRRAFAFNAQISFLFSRYEQQKAISQPDLFSPTTISDYIFDKDRIFAMINLNDEELELYDKIYTLLDIRLRKPDLVIYLHAPLDTLLDRIKKRSRLFEKNIDKEYLQQLVLAYNEYFFHYFETPLLVVNTSGADFAANKEDLTRLIKEIKALRIGRKHFVPLGSG